MKQTRFLFRRQPVLRRVQCIVAVVIAVMITACSSSDGTPQSLTLPVTPVISARQSWAVVRGAYVRVLSEPSSGASIEGHLRRGAILQVHGRTRFLDTVDGQRDHWYSVSTEEISGWMFASYVDTYATRSLAETASRALREP
jgi:hypothetical protein